MIGKSDPMSYGLRLDVVQTLTIHTRLGRKREA